MFIYNKMLLRLCFGLLLIASFNDHVLHASVDDGDEQKKIAKSTYFLIVPGQNGMGGGNVLEEKIINGRLKYVQTPESFPDLGQSQCQKYLDKVMTPLQQDNSIKNIVIHATSQGTATVLNYVAKNRHKTQKLSAIILESVMASGNNAIHHTVKSLISPDLANLPGSYNWLPYFAKFTQFLLYNPAGEQAIFACDSFECNDMLRHIPIIITHATRDPQLSFDDAKAVYYRLASNSNPNVYFMPVKEYQHLNLLNTKSYLNQIKAINMIMKKNGLPYYKDMIDDTVNLSKFQPNPDDYKQDYLNLMKRENQLRNIDYYCKRTAALFILAYVCFYLSDYIIQTV